MENYMIKGIEVLVRKNLGNYEHEEVKLVGAIPDGVAFLEYAQYIKNMAHLYLALAPNNQEVSEPVGKENPEAVKKEVKEEVKEVKKAKAKKVEENKTEEGQEIPPVIPTEAVKEEVKETKTKKSSVRQTSVEFDNTVKVIRDRLASYLNQNYPNWKETPKDKITAFLNGAKGQPFEDLKGNMLDSFKQLVEATFSK
jgi:preprotein translocase subunit SecD